MAALIFVLLLLFGAGPLRAWERSCQDEGSRNCIVRHAQPGEGVIVLGADDGRTTLLMAIGNPRWGEFYTHLGMARLSATFDGKPSMQLEKKGGFQSMENGFIFVFRDRSAARDFVAGMGAGERVTFEFQLTRKKRASDKDTVSFPLDGFSATWDRYCDSSPLDWLCEESQ